MNTILTVAAFMISALAFSQNKFVAFNENKRFIELNTGICMKYFDTGNLSGPQLLLLHGYADTSRSFQLLIEDLQRAHENVRIVAPDLRGHGQTSMPDALPCRQAPEQCFTPKLFAEDVIDLMDKLCIDKIHVAGHSMGSIIAQELALNYPDRISSITLIGTFVNGKESEVIHDFLIRDLIETDYRCFIEEEAKATWPMDAYFTSPYDMGKRIQNYLRENWVVEISAAEDFLDAVFPETLQIPLGTWIGVIKSLAKVDYTTALQELRIPTMILWSTQDGVTSSKDQEQVKAAFQSAAKAHGTEIIYKTYGKLPAPRSGYSVEDLGHNMHWGAHKEVADDIYTFITSGRPLNNLPYANPQNKKQILVDQVPNISELK